MIGSSNSSVTNAAELANISTTEKFLLTTIRADLTSVNVTEKVLLTTVATGLTSINATNNSVATTISTELDSMELCSNYREHTPTARFLLQNGGPPEYYPMLAIACCFLLFNTFVFIREINKHSKYFRDTYFKLSARVVMIMSNFWFYAATSLLGMIFVRGISFLHFISHTFESACMLAFFDCVRVHRFATGYSLDGTRTFSLRAPPLCCCFCLPQLRNTKRSVRFLRGCIFQLVFFQTLVEFIRVLNVFDCAFDPNNARSTVLNILVVISFLLAFWALHVAVKVNQNALSKFRLFHKFLLFKLMIIVSKASYNILEFVAKGKRIPAYQTWLGGETRAAIWANFITVALAALLMMFNARLYRTEDYETLGYEQQVKLSADNEAVKMDNGTDRIDIPSVGEEMKNTQGNEDVLSNEAVDVDLHAVGIDNG